MTRKIQLTLILIIFFLGIFWFNHYLLLTLMIICAVLGYKQYNQDRKELKEAEFYSRINSIDKNVSFFKRMVPSLIFLSTYGIVIFLLYQFIPDEQLERAYSIYFVLSMFIYFISEYYQKFVNAIRSFNEGIKLPGRDTTLIPWRKIYAIQINENIVTIQSSDQKDTWQLDNRDVDEMNDIIKVWENNTSNILRN